MREELNIKQAVAANGLTLTEVADRMGITKGSLSQTVNGNPTFAYLRRIAEAVGCSVKDFIGEVPE